MRVSGTALISGEKELETVVSEIVEKNSQAVLDYKKGKSTALQFLVGQGMARTKGQADPKKLRELFKKRLA